MDFTEKGGNYQIPQSRSIKICTITFHWQLHAVCSTAHHKHIHVHVHYLHTARKNRLNSLSSEPVIYLARSNFNYPSKGTSRPSMSTLGHSESGKYFCRLSTGRYTKVVRDTLAMAYSGSDEYKYHHQQLHKRCRICS